MKKGKKGKGGGGKAKKEVDPNAATEVDKAFFELTVADLNKKLTRLRTLNQELEVRNEQLTQEKEKLDEDRSDIIMYLKKILQEKTDEITELEERIVAMEDTRQLEIKISTETINQLKNEYKLMQEQLTSENKLLDGKLNALEEFRCQRDELLRRCEAQEVAMAEQEKRYKREIYQVEKKFIIAKDQLKKDMSAKLLQLSTEFHDATELRIAATTHRVIRENIAVNNELDVLLNNQQKLYNENKILKTKDNNLRHHNQLLRKENRMALSKVTVQLKLIESLTDNQEFMTKKLKKYKNYEAEFILHQNKVKTLSEKILAMEHTQRLLEQNLHNVRCDRTSLQTQLMYIQKENDRLSEIMLEAVSCLKEALTVRTESELSLKVSKRESLLNSLLTLLNKAKDQKIRCASLDSVSLFDATYAKGDLGFVPKPVELRTLAPIKRTMDTQTASSFEEYIATGTIEPEKLIYSLTSTLEDEGGGRETEEEISGEEEAHRSVLFFDEVEILEEQSVDMQGFDMLEEEEEVFPIPKFSDKETEGEETEGEETEMTEGEGTDIGDTEGESEFLEDEGDGEIEVEDQAPGDKENKPE